MPISYYAVLDAAKTKATIVGDGYLPKLTNSMLQLGKSVNMLSSEFKDLDYSKFTASLNGANMKQFNTLVGYVDEVVTNFNNLNANMTKSNNSKLLASVKKVVSSWKTLYDTVYSKNTTLEGVPQINPIISRLEQSEVDISSFKKLFV